MKPELNINKRVIESIILSILSISAIFLKHAYYPSSASDLTFAGFIGQLSLTLFTINMPIVFLTTASNTLISKVLKRPIPKVFKVIWVDSLLSTIFLLLPMPIYMVINPRSAFGYGSLTDFFGAIYSILMSTKDIRTILLSLGFGGFIVFSILLIIFGFARVVAISICSAKFSGGKRFLLGQGKTVKLLFIFEKIQILFLLFLLLLCAPGILYFLSAFGIAPLLIISFLFSRKSELTTLLMTAPIGELIPGIMTILGISYTCLSAVILMLVMIILGFNWIIQKIIFEIRPGWRISTDLFSGIMRLTFFLTEKIVPYSIFGMAFNFFQLWASYSFCISGKRINFLLRDEKCRSILTRAILTNVLHVKGRWGHLLLTNYQKYSNLKQRLTILSIAGEVMFELGDLNRANLFYNGALDLLVEAIKVHNVSNSWQKISQVNSLDSIVNNLSDFYLKAEQNFQALRLQRLNKELYAKKCISLLAFLSNDFRIRSKFNFNQNIGNVCNHFLSDDAGKINILLALIETLQLNIFNCKSPAEYDMVHISYQKTGGGESLASFCKVNADGFSHVTDTVKTMFYRQHLIYSYFSIGSMPRKLTSEDLDCLLSESIKIDIFGAEVSFPNSFFRGNLRIIPLVLLETRSSHFSEKISSLMNIATQNVDNTYFAFLNCCYGKWLVDQGSIDEGAGFLEQGLLLYENIRNTINTDQMGTSFGSRCLTYYDWAIDALSSSGQHGKALEYAEASQARALLDLMSGRTTYGNSTSHPKAREIFTQIQDADLILGSILLREQSSQYKWKSPTRVNPFKKLSASSQERYKKSVQKRRRKLVMKLDQIDPVFSSLASFRPLIWRDNETESQPDSLYFDSLWSEHILDSNHAILNFHVIHDFNGLNTNNSWAKIVIFSLFEIEGVIHNECTTIESAQASELEAITKNILSEIGKRQTCKSLVRLSGILVLPVIKALPKNIQSLTICANSGLQFIPWAACYAEKRLNLTLNDRYTLRSVPSLSLLYLLKKREENRTPSISQSLVAGIENYPNSNDYLFWSGFEANKISEIYQVSPLKDKDVDDQFQQKFKDSQMIHYSGHGNYWADRKSDSLEKTILSFYEQTLSAAQILSGSLESSVAKVMILSACLTGRGDITVSGSEVLGLERALFHAGLSALITTLWSVPDFSTALLMVKFHRVWFDRNNSLSDLSLCLGEAQVWMKTVTWEGIQEEFPDIEDSIQHCADRLDSMLCALKDIQSTEQNRKSITQVENQIYYYQHQVLPKISNRSTEKPFQHPYFWAAFQVKGLG